MARLRQTDTVATPRETDRHTETNTGLHWAEIRSISTTNNGNKNNSSAAHLAAPIIKQLSALEPESRVAQAEDADSHRAVEVHGPQSDAVQVPVTLDHVGTPVDGLTRQQPCKKVMRPGEDEDQSEDEHRESGF